MGKNILFIFGTRPEAIKCAPLIRLMKGVDLFQVKVCVTAQHREMLDQILNTFDIKPDYDLNLMKNDQNLFDLTAACLSELKNVLLSCQPELIFVQGDTTTALAGALSGYYLKIPVAHLEAGLRSFDTMAPYPEEINRSLVSKIAEFHFAPTNWAMENLKREGIAIAKIFVVGNTVIDALVHCLLILDRIKFKQQISWLNVEKKTILVTGHRRESFGKPFKNICHAIRDIAREHVDEIQVVYPVHCNPNVRAPVEAILEGEPNIKLLEPVNYPTMIWLMQRSYFILTDSGGIQEEASVLNKPVLIMRDVTERPEGIEVGIAKLIGTQYNSIVNEANNLLNNRQLYLKMSKIKNVYGDGHTSEKIVSILTAHLL